MFYPFGNGCWRKKYEERLAKAKENEKIYKKELIEKLQKIKKKN